ncbi:MAG: type II toxin-antitoxin system death-on-curing family toxin [Nitrospirae bacterium]|nr:type II toxin-antitoxin system death-on-curing family toxin [Nitrospirota bacterium]
MIYLTLEDLLEIHRRVIESTGGSDGIRSIPLLDSAVARPQATFGGIDLYTALPGKAAALFHSIISNHPFVDGNKRTGFTAMDVFLRLNDRHIVTGEDEKYDLVMSVASEAIVLSKITGWIEQRITPSK